MNFITPDDITIGTQYYSAGKHPKLCTVIDIYKTYNSKNELVNTSYVTTHEFLGQIIKEHNIPAVTIQRGFKQ